MPSVFAWLQRPFLQCFSASSDAPSLAARGGPADSRPSSLQRKLFYTLAAIAILYAFLAGLRTLKDYDLFWQMSTGRWVVQHHQVPSVDVFSYTAAGKEWIYPVGSGLIFYGAYLLGGYGLLSWIGALASCGTIALLLRRGSAVGAAIAILAVPEIAWRTAPRSDLFTTVLFAAFLSLLWENFQTGRARLWLLPLLMAAWVNLHLGFVSGLGLMGAYVGLEVLEMLFSANQRQAAVSRLRRAMPWLIATGFATLLNPWGWNLYRALIRQQRVMSEHQAFFLEWKSVPLDWASIAGTLSFRQTLGTIYFLLAIAAIAGAIALYRGKIGEGVLLLGATVPAVHYIRLDAVFAGIVVVIGGQILSQELDRLASPSRNRKARSTLALAVCGLLAVFALVRCFDLVTNRYYLGNVDESTFGAGLGWWFPQRAAEFIQQEQLPGEVFNTLTPGGFVTWALGPERRDYIDGRSIPFGVTGIEREIQLRQSPPDSAMWMDETARYNINTVLLPVARYQGIQFVRLADFCNSPLWKPVYLDDLAAVFVRRSVQTEALIQRFPVSCQTAPMPPSPPVKQDALAFNTWANSAAVLYALGRNDDALSASGKALAIYDDSGFLHWLRGNILTADERFNDAEKEYKLALDINPDGVVWASLAQCYRRQGRTDAAMEAEQHAAEYSRKP
jgi:hypothetical protein